MNCIDERPKASDEEIATLFTTQMRAWLGLDDDDDEDEDEDGGAE